ncbi:MAG: hypothetical protein ACI4B9_04275 [Eggerthellaceae bacterium]
MGKSNEGKDGSEKVKDGRESKEKHYRGAYYLVKQQNAHMEVAGAEKKDNRQAHRDHPTRPAHPPSAR